METKWVVNTRLSLVKVVWQFHKKVKVVNIEIFTNSIFLFMFNFFLITSNNKLSDQPFEQDKFKIDFCSDTS